MGSGCCQMGNGKAQAEWTKMILASECGIREGLYDEEEEDEDGE